MNIDVDAVIGVVNSFDETREIVERLAGVPGQFAFSSSTAGRNYDEAADRIVAGYSRVGASLRGWSEAIGDDVGRIRASIDGYRSVDSGAAGTIGAPR
ncbi:hypothetical protein [Rhodococcoides kyotonense]|nr:hypothetical protein [Rhodococcus kyotonensis]